MTTRRNFLLGAAGAATLAGVPFRPALAEGTVPPPAREFGMNRLVLDSPFTSLESIDQEMSGDAKYTWFIRAPWDHASCSGLDFSIQEDPLVGSYLRIQPSVINANWSMATVDPKWGTGKAYTQGYFEARMRFDTPPAGSAGFPSFWGTSLADVTNVPRMEFGELDIFEALAGEGKFAGHAHHAHFTRVDPYDGKTVYHNSNSIQPVNADFSQWHTYGAVWSGPYGGYSQSRISWYFDDEWLMTQNFGEEGPFPKPAVNEDYGVPVPSVPASVFRVFDHEELVIVLGSGVGHPMDVQYVRIWQV